jgi:orotate phosphoribosyltransferase
MVHDVVVLIDRQSGAAAALAEAGVRLHAVFTLTDLLDHWEQRGLVDPEPLARVRTFLAQAGG